MGNHFTGCPVCVCVCNGVLSLTLMLLKCKTGQSWSLHVLYAEAMEMMMNEGTNYYSELKCNLLCLDLRCAGAQRNILMSLPIAQARFGKRVFLIMTFALWCGKSWRSPTSACLFMSRRTQAAWPHPRLALTHSGFGVCGVDLPHLLRRLPASFTIPEEVQTRRHHEIHTWAQSMQLGSSG